MDKWKSLRLYTLDTVDDLVTTRLGYWLVWACDELPTSTPRHSADYYL